MISLAVAISGVALIIVGVLLLEGSPEAVPTGIAVGLAGAVLLTVVGLQMLLAG